MSQMESTVVESATHWMEKSQEARNNNSNVHVTQKQLDADFYHFNREQVAEVLNSDLLRHCFEVRKSMCRRRGWCGSMK